MSAARTAGNQKQNTTIAITVGGAPRPLAVSIAANRPTYVIFFASAESEKSINVRGDAPATKGARDNRGVLQSLEELGYPLKETQFETIRVPEQDLHQCVDLIRDRLMRVAGTMEKDDRLVLDFTGGTKLMSAALALAGDRLPAQYSYVAARKGSRSRDKGGLGVTVDGEERLLTLTNPRNVLAHGVIEDAMVLMRLGAWGAAARLLEAQRSKITDMRAKREIEAWTHLAEAYDRWETFSHGKAMKSLDSCLKQFDRIARHLDPSTAQEVLDTLKSNREQLSQVLSEVEAMPLCLDLLANASRRAAEEQYDEAVLRLYRAVEHFAGDMLERDYQIDVSGADYAKLPAAYIERTGLLPPKGSKKITLGLQQRWEVLLDLGEPTAERFFELNLNCQEGKPHGPLAIRNQSVLVHGTHRVSRHEWTELRYAVFSLLRVEEEDLVRFPVF